MCTARLQRAIRRCRARLRRRSPSAGADGEAYNLADEASDVRLRDLAALVAEAGGVDVELGEPDAAESAGFSKATVALMDGGKARKLGWRTRYGIEGGIAETLTIMREMGTR